MNTDSKPTCAVRGMLERNVMCGSVIVGGTYCGFKGDCRHKVEAKAPLFDCGECPRTDGCRGKCMKAAPSVSGGGASC